MKTDFIGIDDGLYLKTSSIDICMQNNIFITPGMFDRSSVPWLRKQVDFTSVILATFLPKTVNIEPACNKKIFEENNSTSTRNDSNTA